MRLDSRSRAATADLGASSNVAREIAETLVKRQSSLWVVGNPTSQKRAKALSRRSRSHRTSCPGARFWNCENSSRYVPICSSAAITISSSCRHWLACIFELGVALCFKLKRKLRTARFHNSAVRQNVDKVRHNFIQQSLIVRDHDHCPVGASHGVHAFGDDLQRVDIETGISFVQNGELGLQNSHLQNFVAFLFAAGKAFVYGTIHQLL